MTREEPISIQDAYTFAAGFSSRVMLEFNRHPRDIPGVTKEQIAAVLDSVRSWPRQDQEELAEVAREIEARRSGFYV